MRNSLHINPKHFYKFFNSKRKVSDFPSIMRFGSRESCEPKEIADMFVDFFQSTYSRYSINGINYSYDIYKFNQFPRIFFTADEELNVLLPLKCSNSPGLDGVPPFI